MFRPEHEAAIRIQIQSLAAMCGLPEDAPEVLRLLSETMNEQRQILEEIRIEIHNQVLQNRMLAAKSVVSTPAKMKSAIEKLREEDMANGITQT